MRTLWAATYLVALSLSSGETTAPSTPSVMVSNADPKNSAGYKNIENDANKGLQNLNTPTMELFNPIDPTLPNNQRKDDDKDAEEEKSEADKNWLFHSLEATQGKDSSTTTTDSSSKFRTEALKSLSKPTDKKVSPKEAHIDAGTSLEKTVQTQQASTNAVREKNVDSLGMGLANESTWKPASTGLAGTNTPFKPAISGLSLDSTKTLSDEAEKAYKNSVAAMKPIQPFELPSTPSFNSTPIAGIQSSTSSFDAPLPVENPFSGTHSINTSFTPALQVTPPSINTIPTEVSVMSPIIPPTPIKQIEILKSPSASTSAYKPKVADPNDYLHH